MPLPSPRKLLGSVGTGVVRAAGAGWRGLCRSSRVQAANAEHVRLESQVLDKYEEMGRIVYQMFQEGRVKTKRLQGLCETVADLQLASRAAKRRAEALREGR